MKNIFFLIILIIFVIACSKGEKAKAKDNVTAKKPLAPIVESKNEKIDLGNQYLLNGNFDKAIEYYNKGLNENRSVAFYNLGIVYYLNGKYSESEDYFRKSLEENKNFKPAYVNLAASLVKQGKIKEAVDIVSQVEPETSKEIQVVAEVYALGGDTAKAYYYYKKYEKSKDQDPSGLISYGLFLKGIGEDKKGSDLIKNAIVKLEERENKDYEDYYQLGLAYYNIENYEKSIYSLKSALNLKKTYEASELLMKIYENQGKYDMASLAAENLVMLNPSVRSYALYVKNLIKSSNYTEANYVLKEAMGKYPKEKELFFLQHRYYILVGDLINAHKVAKEAYEKIKDDDTLFNYIKQSILYDHNFAEAKKLIPALRNSDLNNIARSMLLLKEGNIIAAENTILQVLNKKNEDYNYVVSYLNIKKGNYNAAEQSIELMDDIPEKFFYKFVLYYNTKQFGKLADLSLKNVRYIKTVKRFPRVSFKLQPTLEDLNFAFEFRLEYETFLRLVLTPIIIHPEEMTIYMSTGYNLLKQSDQLLALNELKKSVNFSEGIKHNNNGVKAMLEFDYEKASKEFTEAVNYLGDNPIVYYNIGLLMLNLGDLDKAYEFFDNVLLNNKFIFPAYLGKAICLSYQDERVRVFSQYDMLISNFDILEKNEKKQADQFYYTKLLALIGSKKYDDVIGVIKDSDPALLRSIKDLAILFKTGDYEGYLKKESVLFRKDTVKSLLSLYYFNKILAYPNNDRLSDYMIYYLSLTKNIPHKLSNHKLDRHLAVENIKYDIYFQRPTILESLRNLRKIDDKEPKLFKLSLYYFTLKMDVINAEISLQNLKKLNMDKQAYYYQMLYHFITNNSYNLSKSINKYIEIAPNDYRGYMVELLRGFRENNLQTAYDNANRLEKSVLKNKKLPLEIVLNDF
ncbi:MAG: tetratricopeptide repeat protein [Calditerrivibrio sp.]|nr:tetratricopeptide repeat protein [Calditerrivibrio sp.]